MKEVTNRHHNREDQKQKAVCVIRPFIRQVCSQFPTLHAVVSSTICSLHEAQEHEMSHTATCSPACIACTSAQKHICKWHVKILLSQHVRIASYRQLWQALLASQLEGKGWQEKKKQEPAPAPTYDLQSNAEFQPRKPLIYIANSCEAFLVGMATTARDCAFPMAGSSIVTNPTAPGDQYAHARALHTLLLLQAAPLKCVLVQTWHSVPDSRASPSRCVNKAIHTPLRTKL